MSQSGDFLAAILRQSARGLAGYAASEFFGTTPEAKVSFPLADWRDLLSACLGELAAAVAVKRPEVFVGQVLRVKKIHTARGVPVERLRACLETLRRVVIRELPDEYSPIVSVYLDQALAAYDQEPSEGSRLSPDTSHGHLASEYLLMLLEGDRRSASQLILTAAQDGESVLDLYLKVLIPVEIETGRMWMNDEITVAEEHFITATTKMVAAQLRSYAEFLPCQGRTVVGAAVMGNHHDLGLQIVADVFEMDGWRVIYLGANVPIDDLVQAVSFYRPNLLGLSVALTSQLPVLKATIETVRQNGQEVPVKILVGGCALVGLEDLGRQCGADAYAADPIEAVRVGNRLVGR